MACFFLVFFVEIRVYYEHLREKICVVQKKRERLYKVASWIQHQNERDSRGVDKHVWYFISLQYLGARTLYLGKVECCSGASFTNKARQKLCNLCKERGTYLLTSTV